ncbi:MAG: hypothetical protein EXS16_03485 [Gemmataceae bacterium]|nr:hypothetical protein [Gemmataceae bacterium]
MAKHKTDGPADSSMPVNDAWTGLLAISLIALSVATGFLAWDWYLYDENAVANMKLPNLAGTLPKKPDADAKKIVEKKVDGKTVEEKKVEEKKDEAKKDAAMRWRAIPYAEFGIFTAAAQSLPGYPTPNSLRAASI